jgi:hypothetical protein
LVVGSSENIRSDHVPQALRAYRDDILVIDYDTLVSMYLEQSILKGVDWRQLYTGQSYIDSRMQEFLRSAGARR